MFEGCITFRPLDLSSFDTRKVTDMRKMFGGCNNLETLTFDTNKKYFQKSNIYKENYSCH